MRVGVVDFSDDEEQEVRYCPKCLEIGYQFKLGAKATLQGKQPQSDDDLFMQCFECWALYPKYETKVEQSIEGFITTTENPFDDGKDVLGVPKRTSPAGRKASEKRKRERNRPRHKDPEVDEALRRLGEDNVHIIYDSSR